MCLIPIVNGVANNSFTDCLAVASKFATTVSNGPVANIKATVGATVQCAQLTGSACPDSIINGVCTWQRKLSVTCIKGSPVRIRIQSNGLPGRCSSLPSTVKFSEINIDFEVNFNPDISIHSLMHSPTTTQALDSVVCNVRSQSTVPQKSGYVAYSQTSMTTIVGVAIDNVPILNANMANGGDPFHHYERSIGEER